jgi:hypothetical protein
VKASGRIFAVLVVVTIFEIGQLFLAGRTFDWGTVLLAGLAFVMLKDHGPEPHRNAHEAVGAVRGG